MSQYDKMVFFAVNVPLRLTTPAVDSAWACSLQCPVPVNIMNTKTIVVLALLTWANVGSVDAYAGRACSYASNDCSGNATGTLANVQCEHFYSMYSAYAPAIAARACDKAAGRLGA